MTRKLSIIILVILVFPLFVSGENQREDLLKEAAALTQKVQEHYNAGRYEEAIPYAKRLSEITERTFGKEHTEVAISLNNLALLYFNAGRYTEAEPLYKRALEIKEKVLGKEHRSVAISLNGLGDLYQTTGRYTEAEPLYKRSLEIYEKALGKNHPDVAVSLNNLALLYKSTSRYAEAEPLYKRSLEIYEKAFGKEHPDVGTILSNLALLYLIADRNQDSHTIFNRCMAIEEKKKENIFLLLSERQRLNYMEQSQSIIHGFISHTSHYMKTDNRAMRNTFDAWLRWKGAVMEAQGRNIEAVTHSENPEVGKRLEELINTRRAITRLQLSVPGKMDFEEYKKRLEEFEKKRNPWRWS